MGDFIQMTPEEAREILEGTASGVWRCNSCGEVGYGNKPHENCRYGCVPGWTLPSKSSELRKTMRLAQTIINQSEEIEKLKAELVKVTVERDRLWWKQ